MATGTPFRYGPTYQGTQRQAITRFDYNTGEEWAVCPFCGKRVAGKWPDGTVPGYLALVEDPDPCQHFQGFWAGFGHDVAATFRGHPDEEQALKEAREWGP